MIKKLTFTLIAILTLFTLARAQESSPDLSSSVKEPISAYLKAKDLIDQEKLKEAGLIMKELHKKYPYDYEIYFRYLSLIGFVETSKEGAKILEESFLKLNKTAIENRTEDFYLPYLFTTIVLDKDEEFSKAAKQFMAKYPKSIKYPSWEYDLITKQTDPVKAVELLDSFIVKFEKEHRLVSDAARKKFVIISQNPTAFDDKTMLAAAQKLDELMYLRAEKTDWKDNRQKNHIYYPYGIQAITDGLEETYPKLSLEYAKKGLEYAEANKENQSYVESYIPILMQSVLISYAKLEDWKNAEKTGDELLALIEDPLLETDINESKIRRTYANAAAKVGKIKQARRQLIIATMINASFEKDLDDFNKSHPLPKNEYAGFEKEIKDEYLKTQVIREKKQKESLLKKQISKKAADFLIKDLNGKEVSLKDYKGKVLFLGFWATWCAPCFEEMKEVQIAYRKYANNPNVAFAYICTDGRKGSDKMANIIKKNKYEFPNYYGNDDIQKNYNAYTYPRLFVIGPDGKIGFQHEGYINDGYFAKRVEWMIEALMK